MRIVSRLALLALFLLGCESTRTELRVNLELAPDVDATSVTSLRIATFPAGAALSTRPLDERAHVPESWPVDVAVRPPSGGPSGTVQVHVDALNAWGEVVAAGTSPGADYRSNESLKMTLALVPCACPVGQRCQAPGTCVPLQEPLDAGPADAGRSDGGAGDAGIDANVPPTPRDDTVYYPYEGSILPWNAVRRGGSLFFAANYESGDERVNDPVIFRVDGWNQPASGFVLRNTEWTTFVSEDGLPTDDGLFMVGIREFRGTNYGWTAELSPNLTERVFRDYIVPDRRVRFYKVCAVENGHAMMGSIALPGEGNDNPYIVFQPEDGPAVGYEVPLNRVGTVYATACLHDSDDRLVVAFESTGSSALLVSLGADGTSPWFQEFQLPDHEQATVTGLYRVNDAEFQAVGSLGNTGFTSRRSFANGAPASTELYPGIQIIRHLQTEDTHVFLVLRDGNTWLATPSGSGLTAVQTNQSLNDDYQLVPGWDGSVIFQSADNASGTTFMDRWVPGQSLRCGDTDRPVAQFDAAGSLNQGIRISQELIRLDPELSDPYTMGGFELTVRPETCSDR